MAEAPASIAIHTSSIDFMQQTFTRVWVGGFIEGEQSSLPHVERICVFCGASPGARPAYREVTGELARLLVSDGIGVVFGGGGVGLMGALADAVLADGGQITGVIPRSLVEREIAHRDVTDMRVVGSMHERKALMADLADAFIALPGGLGTLEELFEVYTWAQLGLHRKPCALLNVQGYYDGIADFLSHAVEERFVREEHREMLIVEREPRALIERLRRFEPDAVLPKWIDRKET
jgi:uncharacterized protein (TIGR00730 family)